MYRAAVITKDSQGKLMAVSTWLGTVTANFDEALGVAEAAVKAGSYNEAVVLHVAAIVKVKREVTVEKSS